MAVEIRPQPGAQTAFLASNADIVIYGGAAGSGKTYAVLLEALRHIYVKGFGAVIFRRESVQITNEGGLWDSALGLYPKIGGVPVKSPKMCFTFGAGTKISFSHLNQESDILSWQGSQIPLCVFDELTHFTRNQFWYMLSRNRSACGVRPYVRATTNPDADSWVAEFISWWIDQKTGYPIKERSGVVRYFCRVNDQLYWDDSAAALAETHNIDVNDCKSLTFISASIRDNPTLLKVDPGYLANLKALSYVERERLLEGNWKIRPAPGLYFNRNTVTIVDSLPHHAEIIGTVRAWDLAATKPSESNPNPDYTAGAKMIRSRDGKTYIIGLEHDRLDANDVRKLVHRTAVNDGHGCRVCLPQDPGQAGKDQAQSYISMLCGYPVVTKVVSKDKINRAEPFAAQWQAGNVYVLRAHWNESLFSELERFPDSGHDDIVDACSDAFAALPESFSAEINAIGQTESSHADW